MALPGLDKVKEKVEEDMSRPKLSPFDVIGKINNKQYPEWDEQIEKEFSPFLTNKFFSQLSETIFYAADMNEFSFLPKKLQFDYFYHKLKRGQRYTKWAKGEDDKDLEVIAKHYCVNIQRAKEMKSLSKDLGYDIMSQINSKYGGR